MKKKTPVHKALTARTWAPTTLLVNWLQGTIVQNNHKPRWIYGIELWGFASTSNLEILERF